jgi:hypothetical protein
MAKIFIPAFEQFIKNLGFEDNKAFEPTEENLTRAEKLIDAGFKPSQALEIMRYDEPAYKMILDFKQTNPNINLDYAINKDFNNAQVEEVLHAIHYNYEVEFGSLKDRGKEIVDLSHLSDPSLSSTQMYIIISAVNENLDVSLLLSERGDFPKFYDTLDQLRANKLEVHQQLRANGHDIADLTQKELSSCYQAYNVNAIDLSQPLDTLKSDIIEYNNSLGINQPQPAEEIVRAYLIAESDNADNLSKEVLQNLINEYQASPGTFDRNNEPAFNPEKIQGIKQGIPADKFADMNWNQSWLIRTNIIHHDRDITPYVTPQSTYSEMFTVGLIMQNGLNPNDFSKEQINVLSNILIDENHINEKHVGLINSDYSVDDIKYLREYIDNTQESSPKKLDEVLNARGIEEPGSDSGIYNYCNREAQTQVEFNTPEELFKLLEPYDIEGKVDKFRLNGSLELSNGEILDITKDSIETIGATLAYELKQPGIEVSNKHNFKVAQQDVDFD